GQFDAHGRSLAEAVGLVDRSNRRTEGTLAERREMLETLVGSLDGKTEELDQRLTRFSGLLDQLLHSVIGTFDGKTDDLDHRFIRFSGQLDQSIGGLVKVLDSKADDIGIRLGSFAGEV